MPPTRPHFPRHAVRRARRIAAGLAAVLATAACYPDAPDIATGEMILGMTDALNDLQTETAILQDQIDSLVAITARQDSLIRRLADHTGMPLPR